MSDKLFDKSVIAATASGDTRTTRISVYLDGQLVAGVFTFISNSMTAASDVQVDRTFNDDLLVTGFGQKATNLQIAGISLEDAGIEKCEGDVVATPGSQLKGKTLPELYLNYHAGRRQTESEKIPVMRVVYGKSAVFEGFLVGLTQSPYTISDGKSMDVIQYTLSVLGNLKAGG
jgi:hypothetical protein